MSVQMHTEGPLAILAINRPEVYNCLNVAALMDLRQIMGKISFNKDIRVVIVTGAGEKAFCAGADLKERRGMSPTQVEQYLRLLRDTFTELEKTPKPVIAAINGAAFGGGTELALACDLRVMDQGAAMGLTETSLGIIPGGGGTQRLSRLVGKGMAKELIFTARKIGAEEAKEMGLVNKIAPAGEALRVAKELATEIAANAPIALAQAKYAIDFGLEADLSTGLAIEANAYQVLIPTKDRLEGLKAFAERRRPVYLGE